MRNYNCVWSVCRFLLAGSLLAVLSACATSGVIQGRMSGEPVHFQFHHSFWDDNGTISAVLPSGEHFSGKFVVGTVSTTGIGFGGGDVGVFISDGNTSDAAAVLMGDRGESMHCSFALAKPDYGLEGGGVGRCKLSTGQVVDAAF